MKKKPTISAPKKGGKVPPYPKNVPKAGSRWLHWKGDVIDVMNRSRHTETLEPMVVYVHLGEIWTRPVSMWEDEARPGIKRFTRIGTGGPFKAGDRAHHTIFGKGIVQKAKQKGSIRVLFDNHGTKEMVWGFAGHHTTRLPDQSS